MLLALLTGALWAAPPSFVVEGLEPRDALARAGHQAWLELEGTWVEVNGRDAPPARVIRIAPSADARPAESGTSRLGRITLRPGQILDDRRLLALRHEVAHQFLMVACPAATYDRLFHEAFAVAASGELERWLRGEYLSTPRALRILKRTRDLDTPTARRALARLLAEGGASGQLPVALARRLRLCAAGARWSEPMALEELAAPGAAASGDALVILNRHSGEVLVSEGATNVPMPFGSTLKPFLIAAARDRTPKLRAERRRPEWLCGADLPEWVDGDTALLRSCNGYFLDWGAREPGAAAFGSYGPILVRLGLGRLPVDMSEAIGARPTLALSPWALAQAYRLLAAASPRTLEVMTANAARGTLAGLPESGELAGVATKTGTVRDPESRPGLGWVVAVTSDLIVVTAVEHRAPRTFVDRVVKNLQRGRTLAGQKAARVQTFGLLPPAHVEARCSGQGVILDGDLSLIGDGFWPLVQHLEHGPVMCLGAPWLVRFPEQRGALGSAGGRHYAGVFTLSPLPPPRRDEANGATRKQRRARRGSDILFTTSRGRYVAGVLAAEDAAISGEARVALGRIILHNLEQARHGDRPLCDTTHCQVFLGTRPLESNDAAIFSGVPLPRRGWLHFSRGGREPWTQTRTVLDVEAILGSAPTGLRFARGRVHYRRTVRHGDQIYDEAAELPCDLLRSRLGLPACPDRALVTGATVRFEGRGRGHGVGLDVEWAKRSGLSADEILERAYDGGR